MESVDRTSINLSEKYWRTVDWMRMWQLLFTRCPNGYATIKAIKNFSCKNWFVQGIFYIIWDNWLDCAVSTLNKSYDSGKYGRHRIASNRMFNQYRYHLIKWNLSWNVCFDRIVCLLHFSYFASFGWYKSVSIVADGYNFVCVAAYYQWIAIETGQNETINYIRDIRSSGSIKTCVYKMQFSIHVGRL